LLLAVESTTKEPPILILFSRFHIIVSYQVSSLIRRCGALGSSPPA
jgi:hypothetical protein